MPDILIDNSVVGMTRVITLSTSGATVADDFKTDLGSNAEFERTDNNSKTTGFVQAKGILKGTATLQLANATVNPNTFWGQTFPGINDEGTFVIIAPIGRAETKNGETKATVTFRQTVGAVVLT